MTFNSETAKEARRACVEVVPYQREEFKRANEPGDYVCPNCGERLSGPARFYTCPGPLPAQRQPVRRAA